MDAVVWTPATTQPASTFIQRLYARLLEQEPTGPVLFLAGGGGSGKSTVAQKFLGELLEDADIVCDGTFGTYATARMRVQQALVSGRAVLIAYIHRPFHEAVRGVADRYHRMGRWVPA